MHLNPLLVDVPATLTPQRQPAPKSTLNQYYLPPWAAEAIYDHHLGHLSTGDLVLDLGSGEGHTLAAVPPHVDAVGVEIDPRSAQICREKTGRTVICGDYTKIPLPPGITAFFGNPSWVTSEIDIVIERAADILPENGKAVFVLPAYMTASAQRVLRWNKLFTLEQRGMPKALFPGIHVPVSLLIFTRCAHPTLVGFELYPELLDFQRMPKPVRDILDKGVDGPRSVWRRVLVHAFRRLGGASSLQAIYACVGPIRPTGNPHWKEQVRKHLQDSRYFTRTAPGWYAPVAPA